MTKNEANLTALAVAIGETIFVLREHDARFENEANPVFENAVASFVVP